MQAGGTAKFGTTDVTGTWAWSEPDTVLTDSGDYEAVSTPSDTDNFKTPDAVKVSLTVRLITPQITATSIEMTYGNGGLTAISCTDDGTMRKVVVGILKEY